MFFIHGASKIDKLTSLAFKELIKMCIKINRFKKTDFRLIEAIHLCIGG